ncbi:MAG: carbon-nitrogen hydrolase family protein [Flavipsychrobacter sp.]|nr:carbon-nitrogen hydrolase family protein [Flavipsychrobacter sp.]
MIIAAAQTKPHNGNIEANINDHLRFIEIAALHGVQLIVFPEMSLTGYERERALECYFTPDDTRLNVLKEPAVLHNMVIIAGAPIKIGQQLHVGSFIFSPDNTVSIYTKQFLHPGEEVAFSPNVNFNPVIQLSVETISLAICADIVNPLHPGNAAKKETSLYVASLFYTQGGISEAYQQLSEYAQMYSMNILMANYTGTSYNLQSAGQSAFWNSNGTLVGKIDEDSGMLVVKNDNADWAANVFLIV